MLDLKRVLAAAPKGPVTELPCALTTLWGDAVAAAASAALADGDATAAVKTYVPRAEHPRPTFERPDGAWQSLNGWWTCAFAPLTYDPREDACAACVAATQDAAAQDAPTPTPSDITTPILVPFSPEANLSGVNRQLQPNEALWYRRTFAVPSFNTAAGERVLLHFEGVDDSCAVWVNGTLVGTHQGAYTPFTFDITDALFAGQREENGEDAPREATLTLCVADPSDTGVQLRGKQRLARGNIYYTAQSGIWQPVWLEIVPAARIANLQITPDVHTGEVHIDAKVTGEGILNVTVFAENTPVSSSRAVAADRRATLTLTVPKPTLWSPEHPFLYDIELRFGETGSACPAVPADTARSTFAFRTCHVAPYTDPVTGATHTRFFLNGKPQFLRGVLAQNYWPDGLMTAPSDEALAADIRAMKAAGFNMLRVHIKVEAERFYHLCDRLGMLVWQDMPSGGDAPSVPRTMFIPTLLSRSWSRYDDTRPRHLRALGAGSARYRCLWQDTAEATVRRLGAHPSVVTWVLMNEGWGQFDSAAAAARVRALDATRPVHAVSGWFDQGAGDYFGVHNYFRPQRVFADPQVRRGSASRACVTCEFGGLVHHVAGHAQFSTAFGYDVHETLPEYRAALGRLLAQMDALEADGLAGYVYTQVSDVEEETNGVLTYDRRVNKMADERGVFGEAGAGGEGGENDTGGCGEDGAPGDGAEARGCHE